MKRSCSGWSGSSAGIGPLLSPGGEALCARAMGAPRPAMFSLAGFCVTLSIMAACLGQATEKVPRRRLPRQATEEEGAGGRVAGLWSPWGAWSTCSQPCGLGVSERTRTCRSPYGPDPWPQRAGAAPQHGPPPRLPHQGDRGRPTFPLHPEGGASPALSFPGGPAVLPLHRQAQPPRAPYGSSAQRHTRHQGLPVAEPLPPPLAPSQILGAPHPGRQRDPTPFHEAARPLRPHGGQEFPGRTSPPRPPHGAGAMPPRHRGSLPLFKPLRQDGPQVGLSHDRPTRHGSQVDGSRPGRGDPLTLDDPQAGQRSRVRETIKPGKYGYGKVPFALPLHKDPSEGAASRSKRDSRDHAGLLSALPPPPPPPRPPSKKPRRKVTRRSSSHEEAAGVREKDPLTSGLDPGTHEKPGQAQPAEGAAQTHMGVEGGRESSSGLGRHTNGHKGGLKRGDPEDTWPGARSSEESLPERSARSPGPSGGEGAQERGSVATGGISSLPRTPPPSGTPPQGQAKLHLTHQVLRDHRVAPKRQDPGTGRIPWEAPEPAPRPKSRSVSGHVSHPPQGQARIRNQRQNEPRIRERYGSRQTHSLFAERPVAPSEPDIWLLRRGQGGPEARGRPGAEGPQWNLYYPGTETFHCEGESKQFKACRREPCPADHPDPRAIQCAAYNDQEFMGRFYQWEPFTDVRGSQRCELNCRPIGHRFYVRHTEKVQDGIPCEASSQDICVAGQCLTPGCDGILGSNRTLDSCGVCGGDHTTCKLVVGNYSETDVPIGYHRILEIPAGATRIHIREMTRSPNYLALRSHNGKSIINGNWAVNPPGRYEAAGTVFVYSRPGNDRQEGESLMADGPTVEPIDVYMIFQQDNPGVSYQFFLSSVQPEDAHREQPPSQPEFGALTLVSPGSPAESPLGHIVRPASAEGRHRIPAGPPVSSGQSGRTRAVAPPPPASGGHPGRSPGTLQRHVRVPPLPPPPPLPQHHSEGSHDYYWRRIGNTACSATCGKGFWQSVYRCISWASQEEVGEEHCHLIPKPIVQEEVCNTEPCPAYWDAGDWSACSKSCGLGTQHRQVLCRQIYANRSTVVHPQRCGHLEKPNATQACQVQVCSHWEIHANWSSCSALCGTGHRTRHVRCVSNEGALLRDSDCPSNNRPPTSEACDVGPCARTWFYSDWSNTCSAECGTGIQRRSVVCLSSDADGEAEENCAGAKPAEMRACSGGPCRRVARWYSGPWSTCSSDCGAGTQRRDVICVSKLGTEFNVTEASECAHLEKPPSLQPCAGTSCKARWFSTAWSACSRSCVGGVQVREVQCLTPNRTLTHLCLPDLKPAQKRPCNVQPCLPELDENCRDKYHNCPVIVQARLCAYLYYKTLCCASCTHALQRRHAGPSR